ncbi:MAG: type II secretion system F family protein [Actinobacteria bacterium]|nr:type II secretion system F family protein [Actinomycetota bacterium]
MIAACLGTALLISAGPALSIPIRYAAVGAIGALIHPMIGLSLVLVVLAMAAPRRKRGDDGGALLLADQVALALRAGLTLEGALREARPDLPEALAGEVGHLLREARLGGLGRALASAGGAGERLYRITDRAVRTGAPVGPAVEALAEELRHEDHARRAAEARRLPVRLLLPLALLILPGFVLALVGPALVSSLARLDIGW